MKRQILTKGRDTQANHRGDFETCPSCEHKIDDKEWRKINSILILEPTCYKSDSVALMAECPECFSKSWVHERMSNFDSWSDHPKEWIERVTVLRNETKLKAVRDWGRGICWNCKYLYSAKIEYNAWRKCKIGYGPARTECDRFEKL